MVKFQKTIVRKTGLALVTVSVIMMLILLWMASTKAKEENNVSIEVPDAQIRDKDVSRIEIFRRPPDAKDRVYPGIEDLYAELEKEDAFSGGNGVGLSSEKDGIVDGIRSEPEIMGRPVKTATAARQEPSSYYETPEEREERHRRAMEEGMKIASMEKISHENDTPATDTIHYVGDNADIQNNVSSGIMAGWVATGVSSLSPSPNAISQDMPVRCMFVRTEKITDGQRTAVRLLDDLALEGTVIPKNTHLTASCSIGSRLDLRVTGIEIGGAILTVGYEAYDIDGSKGIYCPDIDSGARQSVRNSGAGIIQNHLGSRIGRVANDILSTGVSIFRSKSGERSVTVPAGYEFYLVKSRRP